MMDWPPLEEMQSNAHKYLGLSVEDLVQKAALSPDSLTYPECHLMYDCFRILRYDGHSAKKQAEAAILTSEELQALRNLDKVYYEKQKKQFGENQAKLEAERQQRPEHMPKEWVEKIIDNKRWGYVLYRHRAMDGWEDFKALLDGVLAMPLFGVTGFQEIQDSKVAEFVEFKPKDDDEEELDYLRQEFRNRREGGDLRPGILGNVFLLLTDEARLACGTAGTEQFWGYIWAIDPDWSLSEADEDGYDGRLRINITQVFWRFYEFMSTGNFTLKDIWRDFHDVNLTKTYICDKEPIAWHFTNLERPKWPYW
ncbi:uncharacterized protein N7482_002919 [Penicillium canariense]|uniref:Uncharacterized protein n=1 Tax=Penicillium canariense TaxID=189055 RepID=A0A9W9IIN0_9EURO|nr:uncharacterized protein N7482_002919 [Penicillium canariense]KAJ5177042.1 hypothetical protein N7482_002919 [Penicillium canariense]